MNKSIGFISFVLGLGIGSFVTWKVVKIKYQRIADEEIKSVKETFGRSQATISGKVTKAAEESNSAESDEIEAKGKAAQARNKSNIFDVASLCKKEGYTDYTQYSTKPTEKKQEKKPEENKIRIISPDEFGEMGNDKISLIYWADKTISYDDGEIPDHIEDEIGFEWIDHFGEYEDDSVFVRNDKSGTDYEILMDPRDYSVAFPKGK